MGDSYRPSGDQGRNVPLRSRMTFSSGGGNSYETGADAHAQSRGQGSGHSEFTFVTSRPGPAPGPRFPASRPDDSNPPRRQGARRGRGRNRDRGSIPTGPRYQDHNRNRNNNRDDNRDPRFGDRRGRRPFYAPPVPHQRPLLQLDGASPEHVLGVADGSSKFHNLDDLSDSEPEMQLDNDNDAALEGSNGQAHAKKSRVQSNTRADGDSVPKWSNPDPYTAAPPPGETAGRRVDFVSLIRKAKKESDDANGARNALSANADFVSFNDDDARAPAASAPAHARPPPPPPGSNHHPLPPPPPPPVVGSMNDAIAAGALSRPSNRRSADAVELSEPQHAKKKRKRGEQEGAILPAWLPTGQSPPAPWCKEDHSSRRAIMTQWLHNEIMDFYDYVAPDDHENQVRANLVNRIQQTLISLPNIPIRGRVCSFGSYPARLYLPTADMDLVYISDQCAAGGYPAIDTGSGAPQVKKMLWAAARKLERDGIATNLVVIHKARVPLVKFVDRVTGIKVDLSFENASGLGAQNTFANWKREYQDMPYLVVLVKQFLLMRGLNDVHLGGLGGFSIICLVVSHLQLHGSADDIGTLFVKFLERYGNFDLATQRIVMDPPGYIVKAAVGIDGKEEKADRLSIQDPNNPTNNISGGSKKVKEIFRLFKEGHKTLKDRMTALSTATPEKAESILECLLGGNYTSYDRHRDHIRTVRLPRTRPTIG